MLYKDFTAIWCERRWGVWAHASLGVLIFGLLIWEVIVQMPRWIFLLQVAIFWCNLYFAAKNLRWFKKRWVTYTLDGQTHIDEETQELYNFLESQEYSLCQVQFREQDVSDEMTS